MINLQQLLAQNTRSIIILLLFIVCDILTGLICAFISKSVKSSIFREGLLKKLLELILIIISYACDWAFNLDIVGIGTTSCLIAMEGWSILENVESYIPIPQVLKTFMEKCKND